MLRGGRIVLVLVLRRVTARPFSITMIVTSLYVFGILKLCGNPLTVSVMRVFDVGGTLIL